MKYTAIVTAFAGLLALTPGVLAAPPNTPSTSPVQVMRMNARDLMVQAASEKASLELHFEGADRLNYGDAGELEITWANGSRTRYRPDVFQTIEGKIKPVILEYKISGKDRVQILFHKYSTGVPIMMRRGSATL